MVEAISQKVTFFAVLVVCLILPLAISIVCFSRIIIDLCKAAHGSRQKFGRNSKISESSFSNIRTQTISVLLTGLVYCGSWVPYSVVLFHFFRGYDVPIKMEFAGIYLSKSATITSPVIYCLIERPFCNYVKRGLSVQIRLEELEEL